MLKNRPLGLESLEIIIEKSGKDLLTVRVIKKEFLDNIISFHCCIVYAFLHRNPANRKAQYGEHP